MPAAGFNIPPSSRSFLDTEPEMHNVMRVPRWIPSSMYPQQQNKKTHKILIHIVLCSTSSPSSSSRYYQTLKLGSPPHLPEIYGHVLGQRTMFHIVILVFILIFLGPWEFLEVLWCFPLEIAWSENNICLSPSFPIFQVWAPFLYTSLPKGYPLGQE